MRRGRRRLITVAEGIELWRMYKAGESIQGISRALGRNSSSINRVLQSTGGIGPAERLRSRPALSLAEREEISRGVAAGCTLRSHRHGAHRQNRTKGFRNLWLTGCRCDQMAASRSLQRFIGSSLRGSPLKQIAFWKNWNTVGQI